VKTLPTLLAMVLLAMGGSRPVHAQAATTDATATKTTTATKPVGLNFSLELSSAYAFRGLNVFGGGDQGAIRALLAPSITWTIFDTGLSLSWWSAYQVNGANRSMMVDVGLGHEQDFVLGYSRNFLKDRLTLSAAFIAYIYPFASRRATDADPPGAGTRCPVYLEPAVGLTYNGPVEVGLAVAYFAGVQRVLSDYRYLYLNPHVGKTFQVRSTVALSIALSYGYKLFNDRHAVVDNVHDIRFDFELPISSLKPLIITPGVHVGWTNLKGLPVGDEYLIYGGLKVSYDL